jgi:hypothetical protein
MTNHTTHTLFRITACTRHMKCIVDKIYTMTAIISSNDFVRPILRLRNSAVSSAQCCMRCKTMMQKALVTAYFKYYLHDNLDRLSGCQNMPKAHPTSHTQSKRNCYTSVMCTAVWKQYKSISTQSL